MSAADDIRKKIQEIRNGASVQLSGEPLAEAYQQSQGQAPAENIVPMEPTANIVNVEAEQQRQDILGDGDLNKADEGTGSDWAAKFMQEVGEYRKPFACNIRTVDDPQNVCQLVASASDEGQAHSDDGHEHLLTEASEADVPPVNAGKSCKPSGVQPRHIVFVALIAGMLLAISGGAVYFLNNGYPVKDSKTVPVSLQKPPQPPASVVQAPVSTSMVIQKPISTALMVAPPDKTKTTPVAVKPAMVAETPFQPKKATRIETPATMAAAKVPVRQDLKIAGSAKKEEKRVVEKEGPAVAGKQVGQRSAKKPKKPVQTEAPTSSGINTDKQVQSSVNDDVLSMLEKVRGEK